MLSRRSILLAAVLALSPAAAHADTLGVAGTFNVFVLNDMTQTGTDAEGRVAVGHDANLTSYSVASTLGSNSTATNFVVGHTATQTGGTVYGSAVSTGNYTLTNASVSGHLYSGGSINQTGGSTGAIVAAGDYTTLYSPPPTAIVGGNYTQTSGGGPNGSATVGGNLTLLGGAGGSGHFQVNGSVNANGAGYVGGGITYGTSYTGPSWEPNVVQGPAVPIDTSSYTALPFSFATVASDLAAKSAYYSTLTANGTAVRSGGNLNLTGTDPFLNIFNLTSSQLAGGGFSFNLSVPAGSTALININGTNFDLGSFGYVLTGIDAQHILYNAYNASAIKLSAVGLLGSLLAPQADVNFATGNINGTLIANNLIGQGESHLYLFAGNLPDQVPTVAAGPLIAVPLPASSLAGAALLSLLAVRKLRTAR